MPDFSTDPFVNGQLLQSGSTLSDPTEAQLFQFPHLAQAYQEYARQAADAERRIGESNSKLSGSIFDSIGGLIGRHQENQALTAVQNLQAGQYNDPEPPGTKSFANRPNASTGLYTDEIGTLTPAPGTEQRRVSLDPATILKATQGLKPELQSKIINGVQAKQEENLRIEARKQDRADALAAKKQELQDKADAKKAELEERTIAGQELKAAYNAATTNEEKYAVLDEYSSNPALDKVIKTYQNTLALQNKINNSGVATGKTDAQIANLNARTGDIPNAARDRADRTAYQTGPTTLVDPNNPQAAAGPTGSRYVGNGVIKDPVTRKPIKGDIDWAKMGAFVTKSGGKLSENPAFGKVGSHTPGSAHYDGMAFDANWPGGDVKERAAANNVAKYYQSLGFSAKVEEKGEGGYSTGLHLHVQAPRSYGSGSNNGVVAVNGKLKVLPKTSAQNVDEYRQKKEIDQANRQEFLDKNPKSASSASSASSANKQSPAEKLQDKAALSKYNAELKSYTKTKETYDKRINSKSEVIRNLAGKPPVEPILGGTPAQSGTKAGTKGTIGRFTYTVR